MTETKTEPKAIVWADELRPRGDQVVLREIRIRSVGRIQVTGMSEDADAGLYEVIAVGEGMYNTVANTRVPIELEPGDVVASVQMARVRHFLWDREKLCMVSEREILARCPGLKASDF